MTTAPNGRYIVVFTSSEVLPTHTAFLGTDQHGRGVYSLLVRLTEGYSGWDDVAKILNISTILEDIHPVYALDDTATHYDRDQAVYRWDAK